MKASPISAMSVTTTLSSPAGSPASSKILAISAPPTIGVFWCGLRTTRVAERQRGGDGLQRQQEGEVEGADDADDADRAAGRRGSPCRRPARGGSGPRGAAPAGSPRAGTPWRGASSKPALSRVPPSSATIASMISSSRSSMIAQRLLQHRPAGVRVGGGPLLLGALGGPVGLVDLVDGGHGDRRRASRRCTG